MCFMSGVLPDAMFNTLRCQTAVCILARRWWCDGGIFYSIPHHPAIFPAYPIATFRLFQYLLFRQFGALRLKEN